MEKENWLLEETLLHEKYQIKKVLGQGGFGITYLAYDQTLQQNVAIKEYFPVKIVRRLGNTLRKGQGEYELSATAMVYPQNGQEEKYLNGMQNFLEEAQVLFGKFDVEGLAAVKDYFEENGTAYIVMEYLSGPTLQEYEKEHKGKISEKQAEILLEPVINALAYIHSIGIVHCDISPDNLIFNKEGQLKLIDFGAAKNKKKEKEEQYCKGGYTAPEQYLEKEFVGPWSDVYSLCAVWYEMLTGIKVPPAVERLQKDRLKNMTMASEVSEQTNNILKKGLSLEIQKRYFSVLNLSCDIKSNMESKEEITKQYMKDTRFVWGTLWLQITTDINERNISQEKKWLSRRKVLGQRGFGVTYLAYDEELCQEVVLKKYRWEHGSLDNEVINKRDYYKKQRKAFLNEARILSSLFDIKEVVKVLDYFEERRTSSPYKKATTGKLTNGDAIYYGDILQVTYSTLTNWTIDSHGKEKITVTGNVTSADIYMIVWSDWSEWPDDADTESNTVKVESKSQYRYSDKATTTSTNASLPGWIQTGSTTSYGGWGSWSVWQTNAIGGSDTRQVETATVYPYYYFYCKSCGRGSRYPYYGSTCAYCNSSSYVTLDTGTVDWFTNSWSSSTRWGSTSKYYQYIYDYHAGANAIYWNWTDGNAQTGYRYRDRSKTITYSYYKWNDWSSWSDTAYSSNGNRKVDTKTVYRIKKKY